MPVKSKPKRKRTIATVKKATITKVRRRATPAGVSVMDLVGTIKLTVDPVEFQRAIRDEW